MGSVCAERREMVLIHQCQRLTCIMIPQWYRTVVGGHQGGGAVYGTEPRRDLLRICQRG